MAEMAGPMVYVYLLLDHIENPSLSFSKEIQTSTVLYADRNQKHFYEPHHKQAKKRKAPRCNISLILSILCRLLHIRCEILVCFVHYLLPMMHLGLQLRNRLSNVLLGDPHPIVCSHKVALLEPGVHLEKVHVIDGNP